MVTVHAMWILIFVVAAYMIGMVVGWWFTKHDPERPQAVRKDYAEQDYITEIYGDIPNLLKKQAE